MTTETLDKLYLEWSNFTQARTKRELELEARILVLEEALRKLTNEVAAIGAFAFDIRELIGETNWNVLTLRLQEARAALRGDGK